MKVAPIDDGLTAGQREANTLAQLQAHGRGLPGVQDWKWRASGLRIHDLRVRAATQAEIDEVDALSRQWEAIGVDMGWMDRDAMTDGQTTLDPVPDTYGADVDLFEDEHVAAIEVIEDAAGTRPLRLRIYLSRANRRNLNQRVYPLDVMQDMAIRGREKCRTDKPVMYWPHPPKKYVGHRFVGWDVDPRRAAAVIDDVYMRSDKLYIDVTFLDSVMGNSLVAQYKAGKKLHVSLRALGPSKAAMINGEPTQIATHMTFFGGDFVPDPALPEAGPEDVLTDSQIAQALTDSAVKEQKPMDPILLLKARLQELINEKAPAADIAAITDSIARLEAPVTTALVAREIVADPKLGELTDAVGKITAVMEAQAGTVKALQDAEAVRKAEADRVITDAKAREDVKTFTDSLQDHADMVRHTPDVRAVIMERVNRATTPEAAQQAFTDAVSDFDKTISQAKLSAVGYQTNTGGSGQTRVETKSLERPWMPVVDKMTKAFEDHARLANSAQLNPTLKKANTPFVEGLIAEMEKKNGRALMDNCRLLESDAALSDSVIEDSTTTSDLFNQPTILMSLLMQQYWQSEALQFCQGIGPNGFTNTPGQDGGIGSVLRVPVEYLVAPSGSEDLPAWDDGMVVGENVAIPELIVRTNWLPFYPVKRAIAFSLSLEAMRSMLNGPLNYDAWARHMFHVTQHKKRKIDLALYREMQLACTEFGAVTNTAEAVAAAEWEYNTGGSTQGYGANVCGVAQLLCDGTTGAPGTDIPIVRSRTTGDLNAQGQFSTTVVNPFTVATLGGITQVEGYLGTDNQIGSFAGTTATFAVDHENGKVLFKVVGVSGAAAGVRPTCTYAYETNYDEFNITSPVLQAGETLNEYYAKLLQQIDTTNAYMGGSPRYMPADVAIMSFNTSVFVANAATFRKDNSPNGSTLVDPKIISNSRFADRNGVELAKINTPWSWGDRRILLQRNGSTKYGVDTPFAIDGPHQKYASGGQTITAAKIAYGAEISVICTPQAKDQSGVILNPVSRSIRLV